MLIDKDDVKKELEAFADTLTVIGGSYIRSAVRLAIEPMKETDAVPVVRCKDCKLFKTASCAIKTLDTDENGFCSYAERRQDEAN